MKITSLLTQYLYAHHRLDLPGIGSFILDPSALAPATGKNVLPSPDAVRFEYRTDLKEPKELIQYISEHSGKMKALASSDLESFIELAQQFLNIGKPFTLEGVGTLVRIKPGEYEFTSALEPVNDKRKEAQNREAAKAIAKEEAGNRYDSFLNEPKQKEGFRKPVIVLLIVIGLGLAIWGGYSISKKPSGPETETTHSNATSLADTEETKPVVNDTTQQLPSEPQVNPEPVSPSGEYKYVLETTNRQRAFKRYNQLLTNLWKVKLETNDSLTFKLYLNLPKNYGDTTRIKDSLRVMLGRPVFIE